MIIQTEVTCKTCVHRDHSGAFTKGGAKDICGHPDACKTFYPHPKKFEKDRDQYHYLANGTEAQYAESQKLGNPSHWKHRLVNIESEPPKQCPLRKFEVGK